MVFIFGGSGSGDDGERDMMNKVKVPPCDVG